MNNGTHVDWADWSEVAAEEDNPPQSRHELGGRHEGTDFIVRPCMCRKAISGTSRSP